MKYGKISLVLAILLLASVFSFAFVPNVAAYTITVDGDPSDWLADTSGQADNTRAYYVSYMPCGGEYVWKDEAGDDTGTGTYTYPTNTTAYPPGICDIREFRVTSDLNNLFFLFKMADVVNPEPSDVNGFKNIIIVISIDTNNVNAPGQEWLAQDSRVRVRGELCPEYQIVLKANATGNWPPWVGSFVANHTWNPGGWWDWYSFGPQSVEVKGSTATDYIETRVPLSFTDHTGQSYNMGSLLDVSWKFVVVVGFANWVVSGYAGGPDGGSMREVEVTEDDDNPGGGTADWADPDVMDMCFYGTKADQEADLAGWSVGTPMYVGGVSYCQGYDEIFWSSSEPPCPYAKVHLVDSKDWKKWDLTPVWVGGSLVGYKPGDSFTLDVVIENVTDLYAWDIGAAWDPAILTCNSIKDGTFLTDTGYATSLLAPGTIDNTAGKIYPPRGVTLVGAPKGQNGSSTDPGLIYPRKGPLANMTFTIKSPLTYCSKTWINLTIVLWDSRGKPITMPINHAFWHYPPPPPSPPDAKISQSPPAAPYWVGDPIILWSTSTPGSNGVTIVPLNNCTWTIRFSDGSLVPGSWLNTTVNPVLIDCQTNPGCPITFTPLLEDIYTIILEVRTKPDAVLDPLGWNYDSATKTKEVKKRAAIFIDCFTNKNRRCGYTALKTGTGANESADAYTFDELVTLYAWVVYKNNPMQNRLVSFEVRTPAGLFLIEQNMTDANGLAYIRFRIPIPCDDPEMYKGKWWCFQKVMLCDSYYVDILEFDVGWIVHLQEVELVQDGKPVGTVDMRYPFGVWVGLKNIAMAPRLIVLAIKVFDDNLVLVVHNITMHLIPGGTFCNPYYWDVLMYPLVLPKWTYPGTGKVVVDAWFNGLPIECGHCCCPPISKEFVIETPLPPPPDPP